MPGFNTLADTIPIDFSGQSGATGTMVSEQLDHYEVGTWTPVLTGVTSFSPSIAIGLYTRIGNLVRFKFRIYASWSEDGQGIITGLPFTGGDTIGSGPTLGYQNAEDEAVPTFYTWGASTEIRAFDMFDGGQPWVPPTITNKYLVGSGIYTLQDGP